MSNGRRREDYSETNGAGQVQHYAKWIGGPSLAKIEGVKCPDGLDRTAFIVSEPDSAFSQPAYVHYRSKKVKGFLTCDLGVWAFHSPTLAAWEWIPALSRRVKIGDIVIEKDDAIPCRIIGWTPDDGMGVAYSVPRLLVLRLSENFNFAYIRHLDQKDVTRIIARHKGPEFISWFFAGDIASDEEILKSSDHGSLSDFFFAGSCNPDGSMKKKEKS